MDRRELKKLVFRRFVSAALVMGALFFLSAGTLLYWQAWVYMAVLLVPVTLLVRYLIRNDPDLLVRRLTMREERKQQGAIVKLGALVWLSAFLVPGLDQRFGWSSVPWPLVISSDLLVLAAYLLFFLVLRENSYASRIVAVQEGQKVITTGPYALVRHPMYLAVLTLLFFSTIALGSFWAMIPALLTPVFLVLRILDEEDMLFKELPGYREYARQTQHRLVPGIW